MRTIEVDRLRRSLQRGGWIEAAQVAALIFLTLLAVAALLLVAGKLQFTSLGSGSNPLEVLRAIGLVALVCLGAGINIGGLTLSVIPLGAITAVAWSGARLAREVGTERQRNPLTDVLKLGAAFGVVCLFGALVFRFGGDVPMRVSALEAGGLGVVWGCIIAGVGKARARDLGLHSVRRSAERGTVGEGVRLALKLGVWTAFGATVALLCFIVFRLASGPLPRSFGVGDASAALIYLAAFLPNALVAVFSLAVGATLRLGAQVDIGGEIVGPLREHSLFDWGRGDPPVALFLLIALPLTVTICGGVWAARRRARLPEALTSVAVGGTLFAIVVGILAALADARFGGGLVREHGLALVTVDSTEVALLTLLWSLAGGAVGVALERWKRADPKGARP
jgi:hypothetical protein